MKNSKRHDQPPPGRLGPGSRWWAAGVVAVMGLSLTLLAWRQAHATPWPPLLVLGLSAVLTLAASAYVMVLVGRARQVEDAVRQRTAELRASEDRLRRTVRDLRRTTRELARSNAELEQFASIASHDLQEPLRKVQAFADLLVSQYRDALGEEGQDYLSRMQNATTRMRSLIDDLLTYSRVTTRARPFKQVNLNEIVTQVLADLEISIRDTQGRVEVAQLPVIDAEPLQMRQLFQNLIGNALKFHQKGIPPRVKVYTQERQADEDDSSHESVERFEIVVEDNGIGFDERHLDEIFVLFKRLHGRGEYEGTGIGLAICRKIVQQHGGTITARSVIGQGARFIIRLPLHQSRGDTHR
jgi:light-regulated signal transduction histidine kinase (bacteriophytochrome)